LVVTPLNACGESKANRATVRTMASQSYSVEVKSDFLEKITRANPIQALAEFIWNSLDADASAVDVKLLQNELGALSKIIVSDNGTGMLHEKAPELFTSLGGSWKRPGGTTQKEGRYLHGQDGRGRFKAFALGQVAEWFVIRAKQGALHTFTVTMKASNIKEVTISDEERAGSEQRPGVTVIISDLHKDFRALTSDTGIQEFTEIFALYLADYKNTSLTIDGRQI
jgi:DNA topoisomerase VI subunit B